MQFCFSLNGEILCSEIQCSLRGLRFYVFSEEVDPTNFNIARSRFLPRAFFPSRIAQFHPGGLIRVEKIQNEYFWHFQISRRAHVEIVETTPPPNHNFATLLD